MPRSIRQLHRAFFTRPRPAARLSLTPLEDRVVPSFAAAANIPLADSPHGVAVADFNRDGIADVAVTQQQSNTVQVFVGNGSGGFTTGGSFGTGQNPYKLAVADMNGDGKADLVVANFDDKSVSVLLGVGNGTFGAATTYTSAVLNPNAKTSAVAVGDFDRDGHPDVLASFHNDTRVLVFAGSASGALGAPQAVTVGTNPNEFGVADFNRDGKLDFVVANAFSADVSVMLGNGDGTFAAAPLYDNVGFGAAYLTVGDFNRDGKPDMAVSGNTVAGSVYLAFGNGDGTFRAPLTITPDLGRYAITGGDFDADGLTDLAVTTVSGANGGVAISHGDGLGGFAAATQYATGSLPLDVAAGDFNRDGKLDLVVPNQGSKTLSVLLNTSPLAVAPPMQLRNVFTGGAGNPRPLVTADFNRDGQPDIATGMAGTTNNIHAHLGIPDGTFQTPQTYSAGFNISDAAAGDWNRDGKADLVFGFSDSKSVGVMLGNGDGTFQALQHHATPNFPAYVSVADLNGDGTDDLVVTTNDSLNVLVGNGDGTFQPVVSYPITDGLAPPLAVADLDRDGDTDVVTASKFAVTVWLNGGTGTLQQQAGISVVNQANALATGDLNRDGIPDLVVGSKSAGGNGFAGVMLGNGNGTFQAITEYPTITLFPYKMVVEDLNADGKPDLAVAVRGNGVRIFDGNGDGTFSTARDYLTDTNGFGLVVADFNRDGRSDVTFLPVIGGNNVRQLLAVPTTPLPLVVSTDADTMDGGTIADPVGPDGRLSLREAITVANFRAGADAIAFNIPGGGVRTITLTSGLPTIVGDLTIDGFTQPGASPSTLPVGDNAVRTVQIDGALHGRLFTINSGNAETPIDVTIRGLKLSRGNIAGDGGAVLNGGDLVTIEGVEFTSNHAHRGGALAATGGTTTVRTSRFDGNITDSFGGAIYNAGSDIRVEHSSVTFNLSAEAGGLYQTLGTLTLIGTTFEGNTNNFPNTTGGGMLLVGGTAHITDSTFVGNGRPINMGGTPTYFTDRGGGLRLGGTASAVVESSTFSANIAGSDGGGIYTDSTGTLVLRHVTMTGNTAAAPSDGRGGGLMVTSPTAGTVTLLNTVIAGNSATVGADVSGPVSGGGNLIGTGDAMSGLVNGTGFNQVGTDLAPIDARLAPLADNGGWTRSHAYLGGSPAIDTASAALAGALTNPVTLPALATDQRGLPRVVNGSPDIGAIEARLGSISAVANQTVPSTGTTSIPFTVASPDVAEAGWSFTTSGGTSLGTFAVQGSGTSRTLLFTPNGASGSNPVTVSFLDGSGRTASSTFNLTVTAAPLVVTTDADTLDGGTLANPLGEDGLLSLREAITVANLTPGRDSITFNIPGGGVRTISVGSGGLGALPAITGPVTIEGYSQPGTTPNTLAVGDNAAIRVALDGANAGPLANGITIRANETIIRGLSIGRFSNYGIAIESGVGNRIIGNFIGTDVTGLVARGNAMGGVFVQTAHNVIGGADPADRNVVSANGAASPYGVGVYFFSTEAFDNRVFGNYVGPAADGTTGLGNAGYGIVVDGSGAFGNYLGGVNPGEGNVISWNGVDTFGGGILLLDTSGNQVRGNLIGTTATGTGRLGNDGVGVRVAFGSGNVIGGTTAGARNVIADTAGDGVQLQFTSDNTIQGNFIGTNASGFTDTSGPGPNSFGNAGHGIAVYGSGNNLIGGTTAGAGNLISGNKDDGIRFGTFNNDGQILGSTGNTMQGNLIGTNAIGTAGMGNGRDGIFVSNSSNNLIGGTTSEARNVISGNGNNGIGVSGGSLTPNGNVIQGNFIGTNAAGTAAIGNRSVGIGVSGATNTTIGGTAAGAGNVISGNAVGIALGASGAGAGTVIRGNRIGTDAGGTAALGNYVGVGIANSSGNTLGGTATGAGNVISGNALAGVVIVSAGTPATGNQLLGNAIGTAADRLTPLGNGGADPILLTPLFNQSLQAFDPTLPALTTDQVAALDGGVVIWGASGNTVGGTAPGAGNVIANTRKAAGNYPTSGNGVTVDAGTGNRISGNDIVANEGLGIDLVNDGNNNQPAPAITSATPADGTTTVVGTLTAAPNTTYTLEFFSTPIVPTRAYGFVGTGTVTTDATGIGTFEVTLPVSIGPFGATVTATATSPANDTSEFSDWPSSPPTAQPYAVGSGPGMTATVRLIAADGSDRFPALTPFGAAFTGGARVASGDVTGDGVPDVLAASGPGMAATVQFIDGTTGTAVRSLTPFESSFTGGAFVAAGDLNGDRVAEVVISPDYGGGPRVLILDGRTGAVIVDFFAFEEDFRGGVTTAIGDVDGDGQPDLVVGAGTGGAPRVAVFGGGSVLAATPTRLMSDFFAFEPDSRMGVHLAAADFDGDGKADIVVGPGIGGGPRVVVVRGAAPAGPGGSPDLLTSFFCDSDSARGGVHVATGDVDGDGRPELLLGFGDNSGGKVEVFTAAELVGSPDPVADWTTNPFADFAGGVFVG